MKLAGPAALAFALFAIGVTSPSVSAQQDAPPVRQPSGPPPEGRVLSDAGTVRVIVRMKLRTQPEAMMSEDAVATQRVAIASADARIFSGPAASHIVSSNPFQTIPFTAIEVTEAGLAALAADPNVLDVQYDPIATITLLQSTALIQSTTTTAAGHTGSGWSVAVLDTGVERTHTFLGGRVVYEACYSTPIAGQSTSVCPNGTSEQTGAGAARPCGHADCLHGTHVAGIVGGSGPLFNGVAPDVNILAFQVFSSFTAAACGGTACVKTLGSDQIRALEQVYALRNTYNIASVNMSLGSGQFFSQAACDASNTAIKAAIDNLRGVGIATVIASGNNGFPNSMGQPGCVSSAVSVGSTTDSSTPSVSSFSNAAPFLSLLAPGSDIVSSKLNSTFGSLNGTSMATPHVAGAWAVLKARAPSASVPSVLSALQSTGRNITDTRAGAGGLVKPLIQLNNAMNALVPSCTYAINPTSVSIGAAAASGSITLATPAGCGWTAASNSGFITIDSAASGTGAAAVAFTVGANTSATARTGTATIGGRTFTVTQGGAVACTYSINPQAINITAGAADGTLFVTTQAGCAWSAASNSAFLTLQNGGGRTGSGGVPFSVAANTSATRTGTATIAGRTFTVTQGSPVVCTYAINPASVSLGNIGDAGTVTVTTQAGCAWTAASEAGFLTVSGGAGRVGSGTVPFAVLSNFADAARSGKGSIAGQTFTVSQQGAPGTAARRLRENARADFNGDGASDLLWREATRGYMAAWTLRGDLASKTAVSFGLVVDDQDWRIVGTGDFNGDGKPDLVWHHRTTGRIYLWYMDGVVRLGHTSFSLFGIGDTRWKVVGVGDFNGDGKPDLVWQHDTLGWLAVWLMNNATLIAGLDMSPIQVDAEWKIAGVGDLNADGKSDLIWRHSTSGTLGAWLMNGVTRTQYVPLDPGVVDDFDWQIAGVTDVNGDGTPDLVWHHLTRGWVAVWHMNGAARVGNGAFPIAIETNWKIVGPK